MRLIAVVMGTASEAARATETQQLLSYGFRYYQTQPVYTAGEELRRTRVWAGQSDDVALGVADDLVLTIPRGSQGALEADRKSVVEGEREGGSGGGGRE